MSVIGAALSLVPPPSSLVPSPSSRICRGIVVWCGCLWVRRVVPPAPPPGRLLHMPAPVSPGDAIVKAACTPRPCCPAVPCRVVSLRPGRVQGVVHAPWRKPKHKVESKCADVAAGGQVKRLIWEEVQEFHAQQRRESQEQRMLEEQGRIAQLQQQLREGDDMAED